MSQFTPEDAENIRKAMDALGMGFSGAFTAFRKATENIQEGFEKLSVQKIDDMEDWKGEFGIDQWAPPWIEQKGPRPHKGGYCGFCATATDKEQRKLDSCPQCGKSYMKYGRK